MNFLSAILFFLFSVSIGLAKDQTEEKIQLTISLASSLKPVMAEIEKLHRKEAPNVELVFNVGNSGQLQKQIEHGAPIDVFIPAASKQMDDLENQNLLLENSRKNLLANQLVLVVPKDKDLGLRDFYDLKNEKVKSIAIGEPRSVPAGDYASQVFTYLEKTKSDSTFIKILTPKFVFAGNVRQVLTYVENSQVEAGVAYITDAQGSSKVKVVAKAPEGSHAPIVYPVAIVKRSKKISEGKALISFLEGEKAQAVFKKFGFGGLAHKAFAKSL